MSNRIRLAWTNIETKSQGHGEWMAHNHSNYRHLAGLRDAMNKEYPELDYIIEFENDGL